MIYILNTNIDNNKPIKAALIQIYGIGSKLSKKICDQLGITSHVRIKQLTESQIEQLTGYIYQNLNIGEKLKQKKKKNIQRLVNIACYKGFRHTESLPVRGQRTHTNAQTTRKRKKIE